MGMTPIRLQLNHYTVSTFTAPSSFDAHYAIIFCSSSIQSQLGVLSIRPLAAVLVDCRPRAHGHAATLAICAERDAAASCTLPAPTADLYRDGSVSV